ncbi:MAG: glycosyltransferase [Pseudomonadota bacterium]
MALSYRDYFDLSQTISSNIARIPPVDIVVGVPKSGLIPGTMIATMRNLPFFDLDGFLFSFNARKGQRRQTNGLIDERKRVLIVDDSVNTGNELRRTAERLAGLEEFAEFTFCGIYGNQSKPKKTPPHFTLEVVPQPRIFQWNYRNHIIAENACFDMDGVLCVDPTADDNDDGPRYREFIESAAPLYIPTKRISAIVTSRLERYRKETEAWLKNNGVRYGELIMLDLPDAETRRKLNIHAAYKAEVFGKRSEILFVESNHTQAEEIARLTDKPVLCTDTDTYFYGCSGAASKLDRIEKVGRLENENHLLRSQLDGAMRFLKEASIDYTDWADSFETPETRDHETNTPYRRLQLLEDRKGVETRYAPRPAKQGKGLRIAMISTSFDVKLGAGAAASSARLRDCLTAAGHTVETFSLDNYKRSGTESSEQPIRGTEVPMWISLGSTPISKLVVRDVNQFAPDCIVLGAIDRSILGTVDLLKLNFPIVWIARDNLIHTGACLFKVNPEEVEYIPNEVRGYVNHLISAGDESGANGPSIVKDHREEAIVSAAYTLKSMVYRRRPDIVFCAISDWMKRELEASPLTAQHEIRLVSNPIPRVKLPSRADCRAQLGLPPEARLILAPVHKASNQRKGFIFAAQALAHLHERLSPKMRDNVVVAIFGHVKDGEDISQLYPFKTVKLGFIEDEEEKARIYKSADVTLVPSLQESLSVVASDSICYGTPVVCFQTSGLPYFVRSRANGFLAQPYNAEDLARGLYWALFQANASSVRKAAAQIGKELFDPKTNTALLEDAMQAAIEKHESLNFDQYDFNELSAFADSVSASNRFKHIYRRSLEKAQEQQPKQRKEPLEKKKAS